MSLNTKYSRDLIWKNGAINGHYCTVLGFVFNEEAIEIHSVPMEAHMVSKITNMFYGDNMFLSTTLLKLFGALNGH